MRFDIRAEPRQGIRIIPEIPDHPFVRIEGRNGIGKTLSARLLELATGGSPYAALPDALDTLSEHLGEVEIECTGLRGAGSVRWLLKPDAWKGHGTEKELPGIEAWIDGRAASMEQVRKTVQVRRVAGDETLSETIAAQIRQDQYLLSRCSEMYRTAFGPFSADLEEARRIIAPVSPGRLEKFSQALAEQEAELGSIMAELRPLERRYENLDRAIKLRDALASYRAKVPDVAVEAARLQQEIQSAQERYDAARQALERLRDAAHLDAKDQARVKKLENQVAWWSGRSRNLRRDAEVAAESVGVSPTPAAIDNTLHRARKEYAKLVDQLQSLDLTPRVLALTEGLLGLLSESELRGLGDEVIVELPDRPVTTDEVRTGLQSRKRDIESREPDAHVAHLQERADALQRKVSLLEHARECAALVETAEDRLEEHRLKLREAVRSLGGPRGKFDKVLRELDAAREDLDELTERSGQVQRSAEQALEGRSPAECEKELRSLTRSLKLREPELDAEFRRVQDQVTRQRAARSAREGRINDLRQEQDSELRTLKLVQSRAREAGLDWLSMPRLGKAGSPDELAQSLSEISRAVDGVTKTLAHPITRLGEIRTVLEELYDSLTGRGRSLEPKKSLESTAAGLRQWYEQHFASGFRDDAMEEALFGGGQFVGLDLLQRNVTWKDKTRSHVTRPLEAFSSGERAFAYTRARLQTLQFEDAENRVVVLDEFGAYLAHDRLAQLRRFIRRRILGDAADKVILILPLSRDYEGESQTAPAPRKAEYLELAASVAKRGYVAVEDIDGP